MLFYDSIGPNPKVVRMFMAERGINPPPTETVDLRGGENRREPFLSKNPAGTCPALALDNGTVLAEITAICEYLDEIAAAGTSLIGNTPEERAETRMWVRRIDLHILEPMANGFRYTDGLKMFENRIHCIPAAGTDLKAIAQEGVTWLDGLMSGKTYICGERLTLADILLFVFLDFFVAVKQPLNEANKNIVAWYGRMKARPSTAA
jgi:glutathione S-transferase